MTKSIANPRGWQKELLLLAAGLGLLTGLVEAVELLVLRERGWLHWQLYNRAFWVESLWISPIVDLLLFSACGVVLILVGSIFRRFPAKRTAWFALLFLAIFDWFTIPLFGRISLFALLVLVAGLSVQVAIVAVRSDRSATRFLHRSLPVLAGLTAILFVAIQGGPWLLERWETAKLPRGRQDTPNVIVIVVDTLRADHVSAYGYQRDTTPFIDSLSRAGMKFDHAIAPSDWTQPSHASMLTGRYTYEHQAETKPLDGRFTTIGEALQLEGYRTGAFSANPFFFTRRQGFGRGFLHFEDNNQSLLDDFLNSSLYGFVVDYYGLRKALHYEGTPARRLAEDINRSALSWVDQDGTKPFFVFINWFDVHDPYTPPQPYRSKYSPAPNPGGLINSYVDSYSPDLTPEELQSEIDAYDGAISYVDDQVRGLFGELDRRGVLSNTIVIITADHGESLGEHGLLQHAASLYLPEIHVPLIIWRPGLIPPDKQVDTPVSTASLPSTILSLVHAQNNPFPEPSLAPLIFADKPPTDWPQPISEVTQFPGAPEQNPTTHGEMKAVVGAGMHYIVHDKFGEELYDWQADLQETSNLINKRASGPIVVSFREYLKNRIGQVFNSP